MTKAKTQYRITISLRVSQYNALMRQAKAEHLPFAAIIRRILDAQSGASIRLDPAAFRGTSNFASNLSRRSPSETEET